MGTGPRYKLVACRAAARVTYSAFKKLPKYIVADITERQLAWRMGQLLRSAGSRQRAFPVIVAFGENASEPHHRCTDQRLQLGDMIKVDAGGVVGGMRGDVTRTYYYGQPSKLFTQRFNAVLQAQRSAFKKMIVGESGQTIDAVARNYLKINGLGKLFIHGLGHGVGRAIHQPPFLSPRAKGKRLLQVGDVITNEPGVYEPGWGGIRLEDMVEITRSGPKWLGKPVKNIQEIVLD